MASQSDVLSLAVQVVDKYSQPIREIRKSLEGLTSRSAQSHKAGKVGVSDHAKSYAELRKQIGETGSHLRETLNPALAGLGLTAVTTAVSLGGVAAAVKEFSGTARDLSFASREIGLSVDQLRAWEAAGENVGISTTAMRNSLKALREELAQNAMHRGSLREFSASQFMNPEARALAERLRHAKDESESLSIIMDTLAGSSQATKHISLEALHLPPEFSRLTKKDIKEVGEILGAMPKEYLSNGVALQHSFDLLRLRAQALRDSIGGELAPAMLEVTEAVSKFVEAHGEDLKKVLVDVAGAIRDAPWSQLGNDIRDAAKYVDGAVEAFGGWQNVLKAVIGIEVAAWVAPIVTSLGVLTIGATGAATSLAALTGSAVVGLGTAATATTGALAGLGATLAGITAPAWLLALLGAAAFNPQPLNKGEDEFARQKQFGLAPGGKKKHPRPGARDMAEQPTETGVRATASALRDKIGGAGQAGGFAAASFREEETVAKAVAKGSFEGTREGVLAAFRAWIQERRQGFGGGEGIVQAAYHPNASGGAEGGAAAPQAPSQGRTPSVTRPPAATTPGPQVPAPNATPRVQGPTPTTPAAPNAPRGATPAPRRPSEAAAEEEMRRFSEAGGFAGLPGQYRPEYKLGDKDLSDAVVNTIAGEAHVNDQKSVDAVINNMLNRVGTKAYGPSADLRDVALAPGQYAGRRRALAKEAEFIRHRIRAIASGAVPDITNGSNEYRAGWYRGPWGRKHANSPVIGGNRFAFNPKAGVGPYGPRKSDAAEARDGRSSPAGMNAWIEQQRGAHAEPAAPAPKTPSQAFWLERGGQAMARHPYWVGEKGPELFVPRESGEVVPHNAGYSNLRSKFAGLFEGAGLAGLREFMARDGARAYPSPDSIANRREPLNLDFVRHLAHSAGMTSQAAKVTGDASLHIKLDGFPKGMRTETQMNGLFSRVTMYRGIAAPMADQES